LFSNDILLNLYIKTLYNQVSSQQTSEMLFDQYYRCYYNFFTPGKQN